jgi:hypothetical protein
MKVLIEFEGVLDVISIEDHKIPCRTNRDCPQHCTEKQSGFLSQLLLLGGIKRERHLETSA